MWRDSMDRLGLEGEGRTALPDHQEVAVLLHRHVPEESGLVGRRDRKLIAERVARTVVAPAHHREEGGKILAVARPDDDEATVRVHPHPRRGLIPAGVGVDLEFVSLRHPARVVALAEDPPCPEDGAPLPDDDEVAGFVHGHVRVELRFGGGGVDPDLSADADELEVAGVAAAVEVEVRLVGVGRQRAVVTGDQPVAVHVGVTNVPQTVQIEVRLVRVGDARAVVHRIGHAVVVVVRIADVTEVVAVGVRLVRVGRQRAVVHRVGHAVVVVVRIADVPEAVAVVVGLGGIGGRGTVVDGVPESVAVRVEQAVDLCGAQGTVEDLDLIDGAVERPAAEDGEFAADLERLRAVLQSEGAAPGAHQLAVDVDPHLIGAPGGGEVGPPACRRG